jgi:aspartyl/glutamyl-tRNA(Asn/Gln) amidotransferase C subunit
VIVIDKINDIELESDEIMIAPWDNDCVLREDNPDDGLSVDDVLRNAPKKFDRFVEVRGVFDE